MAKIFWKLFVLEIVTATSIYGFSIADKEKAHAADAHVYGEFRSILKNYDKRIRPNYTGAPAIIEVDFSVLSFGHIEEVNMIFPVDMFFRQRWHDARLKHNLSHSLVLTPGKRHVSDIIWTPDTVFINSINSKMHDVTVRNDKLDISPNGDVFWGTRITVRGSCRLDLRSYPMDTQTCRFGVESYAYTSDHMVYKWWGTPGLKIIDSEMAQYELVNFETVATYIEYAAGNYSILTSDFTFKRRYGTSILQIYVPTTALVCVSWISLWIDQDSTSARISLCITTLLTLSTIWGMVNSQLPRVSYIKAVDLFFLVSFCFIFFTLVQYTLVLNLSSRARAAKKHAKSHKKTDDFDEDDRIIEESSMETTFAGSSDGRKDSDRKAELEAMHCPGSKAHANVRQRAKFKKQKKEKMFQVKTEAVLETSKIDKAGRVLLPFGYMMFNLYYWINYLTDEELKKFPR